MPPPYLLSISFNYILQETAALLLCSLHMNLRCLRLGAKVTSWRNTVETTEIPKCLPSECWTSSIMFSDIVYVRKQLLLLPSWAWAPPLWSTLWPFGKLATLASTVGVCGRYVQSSAQPPCSHDVHVVHLEWGEELQQGSWETIKQDDVTMSEKHPAICENIPNSSKTLCLQSIVHLAYQ